jgi:Rod binding domain-containing protein
MDATAPLSSPVAGASADPVASASPAQLAATHEAAQNFESFFLSQVFENMFAGVSTDPLFGGGSGETVYRSLLLQQYSKIAAQNGGIGIADAVQREMLRVQESQGK